MLGEFENRTGDPVFDGILRQGLSVPTGAVPVPDSHPGSTGTAGSAFDESPARNAAHSRSGLKICEPRNACGWLSWKARSQASEVSMCLWLRARVPHRRRSLAGRQAQAGTREKRSWVRSRGLRCQFRARLGEIAVPIREHSTPLEAGSHALARSSKEHSAPRESPCLAVVPQPLYPRSPTRRRH